MPAPLSTTGASSESHTWQELEEVFAALGHLARSSVAPPEFYRTVLDQSVRALSAVGGAVWLRAAGGTLQPVAQSNWPRAQFGDDEAGRRKHEALLAQAAADGRVVSIAPRSGRAGAETINPTEHVLFVAPVKVASESPAADGSLKRSAQQASPGAGTTSAIIELLVRPDASPSTYRGYEQFLTAVCELAADYHAFAELRSLRQNEDYRTQLLRLGRDAHGQLNLTETAYAVANQGRGVVGCDRLSVLMARGRRCRLLATSGVSRIERRSGVARRLERVAKLVRRTDEPAFYADGQSDALPPVAEALEQHAEESHARQVAAVPLRRPVPRGHDDDASENRARYRRLARPQFVLVAEQFDARGLERDRLVEAAEVCTSALYNAWEFDRLPFAWLLRPLAGVKHQITSHFPRTFVVLAALGAAVAALVMVPADFNVESTGTLQPIVRRDVFAPRGGLIDEVLVAHGADVEAGQPLVKMRDPTLELEMKRVDGELETARRQLDAVRTTRTNRAIRDANPSDAYRLSAEEREIAQRLTNLRRELELLNYEREQLVVNAPIAGRIITWDLTHRLIARPVERGEVLVTIADLSAQWHLQLDVPDDRIGYVLAAQREIKPELPVRFRLSSDDREQHTGHISEVCQTANVESETGDAPSPTVLVNVALDKLELSDAARRELRPGVSARAQIACGRRPLGYVWLHDIWDTAIEWVRF
jgi:multidrug efflux pump subunit AcrA (membrane-fusion protein)